MAWRHCTGQGRPAQPDSQLERWRGAGTVRPREHTALPARRSAARPGPQVQQTRRPHTVGYNLVPRETENGEQDTSVLKHIAVPNQNPQPPLPGLPAGPVHPAPRGRRHLPMASRSRRLPCSGGMAYLREKGGRSEEASGDVADVGMGRQGGTPQGGARSSWRREQRQNPRPRLRQQRQGPGGDIPS